MTRDIASDLLQLADRNFRTALADPAYEFDNRTGKVAPEHRRLRRYPTMPMEKSWHSGFTSGVDSSPLPLVPNALLPYGLR